MFSSRDAEIIEFKRPQGNDKSLFVSGLPQELPESEIKERLLKIFSQYGLVYGIIVRGCTPVPDGQDDAENANKESDEGGVARFCYALVSFYAAQDARRALTSLCGQLFMKGQSLKIKYCSKMKQDESNEPLYILRAKELANHYLGFNGWSTEIVKFEAEQEMEPLEDPGVDKAQYTCIIRLQIPDHGITAEGVGVGTGTWNKKDFANKASAICRAKKYAHQKALETAFSKILLVVLPNRKVYAEVDTAKLTTWDHLNTLDMDHVLKVSELDEAPPSDEDDDCFIENTADLDDLNAELLAQLHNT